MATRKHTLVLLVALLAVVVSNSTGVSGVVVSSTNKGSPSGRKLLSVGGKPDTIKKPDVLPIKDKDGIKPLKAKPDSKPAIKKPTKAAKPTRNPKDITLQHVWRHR